MRTSTLALTLAGALSTTAAFAGSGPYDLKALQPISHKNEACSNYLTYQTDETSDPKPACAGHTYYRVTGSDDAQKCAAFTVKSIVQTFYPSCTAEMGTILGIVQTGWRWKCDGTQVSNETISLGKSTLKLGAYTADPTNPYGQDRDDLSATYQLFNTLAACKQYVDPAPAPDSGPSDGDDGSGSGGSSSGGDTYQGPTCTNNCSNGEPVGGGGAICPIGTPNPGGICS